MRRKKKDLIEFEADVLCPKCEAKFGVYALLRPGEDDYPVACPDCRHDFRLSLTWTRTGVVAVVQERKMMIDNKKLKKALNRGRPSEKVIMKWFLGNFAAWFVGGLMFMPLLFLLFMTGFDVFLPITAFFVYWVIGLLISAIMAQLSYDNYRFRFKDDGITLERGLVMLNSTSIPYMKIQEVKTNQSFVDSLLGITNIHIMNASGSVLAPSCSLVGIERPKTIVEFLMNRSNAPNKTHVVNTVDTAEENSKAILSELVKIRTATEMTSKKAKKLINMENVA